MDRLPLVRSRRLEVEWPDLLARLDARGGRGAIVGPHGAGKTTLLEDLAPRLAERGLRPRLLRFDGTDLLGRRWDDRSPPPLATARDAILLDGADRLGLLAWRRWKWRARTAGAFVVTAHRPGYLPTLIERRSTPELLDEIVTALAPDDAARLRPFAREAFVRRDGNLRDALRDLYDLYAGREPAAASAGGRTLPTP